VASVSSSGIALRATNTSEALRSAAIGAM